MVGGTPQPMRPLYHHTADSEPLSLRQRTNIENLKICDLSQTIRLFVTTETFQRHEQGRVKAVIVRNTFELSPNQF